MSTFGALQSPATNQFIQLRGFLSVPQTPRLVPNSRNDRFFFRFAGIQGHLYNFAVNLAIEVLDLARTGCLFTARTKQSRCIYLLLEGTDAKVYLINYTPEMEMARSRCELRTNSFVRLRKLSIGQSAIDVDDLGDAERWRGWLGRYQAALRKAAGEIEEPRERNVVGGKQRGPEPGSIARPMTGTAATWSV